MRLQGVDDLGDPGGGRILREFDDDRTPHSAEDVTVSVSPFNRSVVFKLR